MDDVNFGFRGPVVSSDDNSFATISSIHSMDLLIVVRRENLGILDIGIEEGFGADYDIGIGGEGHLLHARQEYLKTDYISV